MEQDYNDIVSQNGRDIGLTHLKEMPIEVDPELSHVASKLYPLPLKHHNFIKEEIKNLLEAELIERSKCPYITPVTVVPRKGKPGASLG